MLFRLANGNLVEININEFLTDADYYKEIIRVKGRTPL